MKIPRFLQSRTAVLGLLCTVLPLLIALFGPLLGSASPTRSVGRPGQYPSSAHWLGLDYLGRDIWARVLHGGLSVIHLGIFSTVVAYAGGFLIGVAAGYSKSILDPILMRGVDLVLAFPALVVLLLAVSALGTNTIVLLGSVAFIQVPGIARLVRSVTQIARESGYVESAVVRGESAANIVIREILPNITPVLLVDFGLRFGQSVLMVASMNFLGLGLQPPASDWGLMIAENRPVIASNPFATLAPSLLLVFLMVGINLLGDAFSARLGISGDNRGSSKHRRLITKQAQSVPFADAPLATQVKEATS